MDDSDMSRNSDNNDQMGVNKMGKNIRKSPLHQSNYTNVRQQLHPQIYNIDKNDFRSIVQQLTGSASRAPPLRPPHIPPKPPSMRLQKIRPPPLTPINRPQVPIHPPLPVSAPPPPAAAILYGNNFGRPPAQYGQPSPTMLPPLTPGISFWPNTAESPISAYMSYLQTSTIDSGTGQNQAQPQFPGQFQAQPPLSGLHPYSAVSLVPPLPSSRMNGPMNGLPPLPSPWLNGPPPLPSPYMSCPLLSSPTSQFLLPSPTGFLNLSSPRSHYSLLSPGNHPPWTSNFSFSPMAQFGILGPGPQAVFSWHWISAISFGLFPYFKSKVEGLLLSESC